MIIRNIKPSDSEKWVAKLTPDPIASEIYNSFLPGRELVSNLAKWSATYAYLSDDSSLFYGLGGVRLVNKTCGHVWVCINSDTINTQSKRRGFIRCTEQGFTLVKNEWNLHRLEAYVRCDYKAGLEFALHPRFGFKVEGVMRKYCPLGKDWYMLARIY
jgi:hypothetical protein